MMRETNNMQPVYGLIDTHCHIDDEQYAAEFDAFIQSQQAAGVEAILVPGVNAESLTTVPAVCGRYPGYLFPAVGVHPEEIREDWSEVLDKIEDVLFWGDAMYGVSTALSLEETPHGLRPIDVSTEGEGGTSVPLGETHRRASLQALSDGETPYGLRPIDVSTRWIAIGEIGLDYHFDVTYKEEQKLAFRRQLDWALRLNLPAMIHSRDATEDMLTILREYTPKGLRGVMHCFSGSHEVAEQIVKMGLYLGIGGVITFKNAKLAEHLQGIPLERIVLETDAPWMAPTPYRGKRNEPAWMIYVAAKLAEVYGLSVEEIVAQTTENAKRLFGLE